MQQALANALALYKSGEFDEALSALQPLLAAGNVGAQLHALHGNIQAKLGNNLAAGDAFLAAAESASADRTVFARFAVKMLNAAGADTRLSEAAELLLPHVSATPEDAFPVLSACLKNGKAALAAMYLETLDIANPHHAMLGMRLLRETGRLGEIVPYLDRVLVHRPDDGMFNAERFSAALMTCDFDVAEACMAAALDPKSDVGKNMLAAESVHRRLMWTDDPALLVMPGLEHHKAARVQAGFSPLPRRSMPSHGGPLKIAYLSSDFHTHATMMLLRQVLLQHDPSCVDFRLFCYTAADRISQRQSWEPELLERIVLVRDMDDLEAANVISNWRADILVDLKGFTGGARLGISALSDCPIKMTWLGYPGSMPGHGFDYAITDGIVTPDDAKPFYEEKLCRLPECYQPNDCITRPNPRGARRVDHGLPEGAFIFASFNGETKITRAMVGRWAGLLQGVENSHFWCLCKDETARRNILAEFARQGIAAIRITFANHVEYEAHIDRIPLADLVLDTFPCNGHTTTSDTLWAGVPVLTMTGRSFAARVAASLLSAIGLPELVANDEQAFVQKATALATSPHELADLRARIAANRYRAPLFDSERFARHLEAAYEAVAERARQGLAPEHMDIAALPPRTKPFAHSG